jgi:hypothetical protein
MFKRTKLMLAAAALMLTIGAITAVQATAGQCTTTCYGSGGYRTCNTHCW